MATAPSGTTRPPRLAGDDAGVALVEFALMLPFLAILVFGTVDLGRAFQLKNRVTNMAREGAFYAQFDPDRVDCTTGPDIGDRVRAEDADLADDVQITVERRTAGGGRTPVTGCETTVIPSGTEVIVTVSTPMDVLTPLVGAITGSVVDVGGYSEVVVQV